MTACGRIVVTAGPTISAADIRSVVPDAEVAPPIAFGQALSYDLRSGDTLLIVDGLFFQQPSVRHKELLTLMADGVRVVGSSSMGALRAAELHPFGMEGYGWVFETEMGYSRPTMRSAWCTATPTTATRSSSTRW